MSLLFLAQASLAQDECSADAVVFSTWLTERFPTNTSICELNEEWSYNISLGVESGEVDLLRDVTVAYAVVFDLVTTYADGGRQIRQTLQRNRDIRVRLEPDARQTETVVNDFAGCKYGWKDTSATTQSVTTVETKTARVQSVLCKVVR